MALRSVCHQGRFELSATSSHRCAPVPVTWVCHWKSKTESLHGTTDLEKIKISARKNVQFRDCGKTKKSGGCLGAEKADIPIAGGQCMVVLSGLPVGRRRGLPRARRPRPRPGWTPDRCRCAQERPLHSSFLLNTFHRISLICVSLWFESQREWEKETTVFVTCPKRRQGESGSQLCQRMLPAPVWVPSLMVQSGALRESSLAVGDLTSAVGDVDGLSVAVLVVSRPGDGGSPRLHLPLQVHDAWASLADVTGKIANP